MLLRTCFELFGTEINAITGTEVALLPRLATLYCRLETWMFVACPSTRSRYFAQKDLFSRRGGTSPVPRNASNGPTRCHSLKQIKVLLTEKKAFGTWRDFVFVVSALWNQRHPPIFLVQNSTEKVVSGLKDITVGPEGTYTKVLSFPFLMLFVPGL